MGDLDSTRGREFRERADEATFKRGFDAGVEYQKRAEPPPVAKALKKELQLLRAAARAYIAAQSADHVGVRVAARENLLAVLGDQP